MQGEAFIITKTIENTHHILRRKADHDTVFA